MMPTPSLFDQARINSLMSAWLPFFASLAQLIIVLYGGYLSWREICLWETWSSFRLSLNVVSADKDGGFSSHASSASSGRVR